VSKPDLALVAKDFSHWFVVEVELTSHSLERHVLPQVRAFCYGDAEDDCVGHLSRGLTISKEQATTLLHHVPRRVVVIANRYDVEWQTSLKALGIELVVLSVFKSPTGVEAYFLEGVLDVQKESLGFGVYSAPDRSVRIHSSTILPEETIQIFDPDGVLGSWNVAISGKDTWITKASGTPSFEDGSYLQLIRSVNGELRFRDPRTR